MHSQLKMVMLFHWFSQLKFNKIMRNVLSILFPIVFHFIATAIVIATDNIRVDVGIIILQFIFILYQVFMLSSKDKN